ncbi:MAG: tol-pal system protein YbgF [Rickettsiaceae bacterium]|nr:tol-pal system protein YbgF [Rickettsiaceae bacterium]
MSKKLVIFFTTLWFFAFCASSLASGEIKRKSLDVPKAPEQATQQGEKVSEPFVQTSSYDEDKISVMERQIQSLLGRIENLEHQVAKLTNTPASSSQKLTPVPSNESAGVSAVPVTEADSNSDQEKQDYDAGLIALKNSDYEQAEVKFAKFIEKYPKSSRLSNAYFWYGESFFRRGNFEKAAVNYLKGYKQFPKADKASDSLLKLSLSLGSMKKNREACAMLDKLDNEFKNRSAVAIKRAKDARNKYGCK